VLTLSSDVFDLSSFIDESRDLSQVLVAMVTAGVGGLSVMESSLSPAVIPSHQWWNSSANPLISEANVFISGLVVLLTLKTISGPVSFCWNLVSLTVR